MIKIGLISTIVWKIRYMLLLMLLITAFTRPTPIIHQSNQEHKTDNKLVQKYNVKDAQIQNKLGIIYWRQGNIHLAQKYWLLAAQGRDNREYGTGSYRARENIRYFFPHLFNPKWDQE